MYIGKDMISSIQIGSTLNNTHKSQNILIQGTKSATFEEIIDAAKGGVTVDMLPQYRVPTNSPVPDDNKLINVRITKPGFV